MPLLLGHRNAFATKRPQITHVSGNLDLLIRSRVDGERRASASRLRLHLVELVSATGGTPSSVNLTDFHAKYFAYDLTRRFPADSPERMAGAVASAQVDRNPHQVDSALFAFHSPLARGALLADEVRVGKTIEAGLIIAQRRAERKRRILVITPSNIRKQWHQERSVKFFLPPCTLLESRSYNAAIKQDSALTFEWRHDVLARNLRGDSRRGDAG